MSVARVPASASSATKAISYRQARAYVIRLHSSSDVVPRKARIIEGTLLEVDGRSRHVELEWHCRDCQGHDR